ncbi:hypothetical protein [Butyrivibrio sp. INlla16]|uniref:hypothetical protein n=1 Tax=Butyrivibrio sp. INlla16 TaxID=1520807 RepID=UPI000887742E|nr:hypothetical protein [Butyrivibrio sp. INlla16]SDB07408.1 hypothetical protein SAMN02910263_00297 [Butyrivibrio sp. INlla16]
MSKIFVGKCPQCDANVYQEEGEKIAKCYYCGSIVSALPKADTPLKCVTIEAEVTKRRKSAETNSKIALGLVIMLGILFVGLGVMLSVLGISYAKERLVASNKKQEPATISNFYDKTDDSDLDYDEPVELPDVATNQDIETIIEEEAPTAAAPSEASDGSVPQYGDLTVNECRAVEDARFYLNLYSFSRSTLMELLSEGEDAKYTEAEVSHALDYMEENDFVDWYTQAMLAAEELLEIYPDYTKKQIVYLLTTGSQRYTQKEAEFAADALGIK